MGDAGGGVCIMEFSAASSQLFGLHLGIHDNHRIPFPELLYHKQDGLRITYLPKVSLNEYLFHVVCKPAV